MTRKLYPLKNQRCKYCNLNAEHHHHNTIPIQVDKFEFVCKGCHKTQNRKLKEESKNEKTDKMVGLENKKPNPRPKKKIHDNVKTQEEQKGSSSELPEPLILEDGD